MERRICGKSSVYKFDPLCKQHYNEIHCKDAMKKAQRKYRLSQKGKEAEKKYQSSEKAKKVRESYKERKKK